MFHEIARRVWLAVLLCLAAGCGADLPTRAISGTVTLDGVPVEQGLIELYPIDGTPDGETGGPIEQGEYNVPAAKGPRAGGTYRVEITSMVKGGRTSPGVINPQGKPTELYDNNIPAIYNAASTLKVIIDEQGENKRDFPLTTQPKSASQ